VFKHEIRPLQNISGIVGDGSGLLYYGTGKIHTQKSWNSDAFTTLL
jgi:hypothetical protein